MRPMRARRKTDIVDNAKADAEFSSGVKARDEWLCRMERWVGGRWVTHGIKGSPQNPLFAAHIYPRNQAAGAKFMIEVGITSCLDCHDRYDLRTFKGPAVRVPIKREALAYKTVVANSNVPSHRRLPPTKPEKA